MKTLKRNPDDTGKTVAIIGIIGAAGLGIWYWIKGGGGGNGEIPPEKRWIKLVSITVPVKKSLTFAWIKLVSVNVSVKKSLSFAWVKLVTVNVPVRKSLSYAWAKLVSVNVPVRRSLSYAWVKLVTVILPVKKSQLLTFQVRIFGIPADFGSYDWWACWYYDLRAGSFVGNGTWKHTYEYITFTAQSPGYLAVFVARGENVSRQYNSPQFAPVRDAVHMYDIQHNIIQV